MQNTLRERLEQFSRLNQAVLFERLERQVGALSEKARLLVSVLGMVPLSRWVAPSRAGEAARPRTGRHWLPHFWPKRSWGWKRHVSCWSVYK